MTWVLQLYLIILLIGSGLSLAVAVVAWRRREVTGAVSMTGLMLAVAWWQIMGVLEIIADDLHAKILCSQLLYLGVATVPVWWFLFALDYSGVRRRLSPRAANWLWLIPALTIVVAFTQGWHAWLWSQVTLQANGMAHYTYGWWFLIHAVYSYALIVSGVILLIRTAWRLSYSQWRQMIMLAVASLFPITLNAIYLIHWGPLPDLDLTAVGFAIAGLLMVWNVFGLHLFDLSPVARDLLVESMDDGVIVLDRESRVVDMNPAARNFLGMSNSPIGLPAPTVFARWPGLVERYQDVAQLQVELRFESAPPSEPKYVELRISPLRDRHGQLIGRLITLHDISQHKQTEARLRQLSASVEQSPATVVITDLDGRIVYVNPKFTQLTGYTLAEAVSQNPRILKSGETSADEYARLWQTITAGGTWRGEFHNRKKNGEFYWESAVISPITDAAGHITHFLAVKEDITARKQAAAIEQQRIQRQQLISEISLAINLSEDVQAVMQASVDGLTRVLGVDEVGLALFDEARQHLVLRADHPAPGNQSAVGVELPLVGNLSTQQVVETRQPLMILDAQHDPLMNSVREVMVRQQVQSILLVPLIVRDQVIGTIGFDVLHTPRAFTPDEVDLAHTIANLVALRLEQARLFEAERVARLTAQRHALDLSGLYAVTRATSRSLVLEEVLAQALSTALTSLQFEAGLIALTGAAGGPVSLQLAAERGCSLELKQALFDGEQALLAHAFGQHEVLLVDVSRPALTARLQPSAAPLRALGWRTAIAIPLLHRDQSLGVICLLTHQARDASPIDMALFASMGHQVAATISHARLFQATLDERSRLKAVIESSRDGIILNSVEGLVVVMNWPAVTLLRLPGTPTDWVNRPVLDLLRELRQVAPQAVRVTRQELRRLKIAADQPLAEGTYEIAARRIYWQSRLVQVGTRPMGRLVIMRDMTEEHALERLREDMTHTMVHDLRNPLTGIVAGLDMLLAGLIDAVSAEQHEVLSLARSSATRMMLLINAILDVNRLESGRMPVSLITVPISQLLREVLPSQAALAHEKQIQLEVELPPDLPPVRVDANLIQRVLQNLIGNALKFTPSGGSVRLAAHLLDKPAGPPVVQLTVRDTGFGIPPEIQGRLFQKFVTGEQQEHGSGLGLAFCRLVLEAHEQRIWVENTGEAGTTFALTLAAAG